MQAEVELKLALDPDRVAPFLDWSDLPDAQGNEKLHAVYFDTPGRALLALGLSLRIRRSGRRRIQTVKAGGGTAAGLFARQEWERPVRGSKPVLDDGNPVAVAIGDAVAAIAPAFSVDVERRVWVMGQGGTAIELVLDRGMVRAEGREEAVCELELELKDGDPAALFALARRIDGEVPVRLGVSSKSERGYRLRDAVPAAIKAEPVAIGPDATIGTAFAGILSACLRHYRLNEDVLLAHYHADALHQARVAVRRMRSALTLFRPVLAAEDVARFGPELRWLAATLGEARDLDVLLAHRPEGDPHRDRLLAAQAKAHERVGSWLLSGRVRALMLDLAEWLAAGAVRRDAAGDAARPFAATRLRKFRRRVVRRGRHMKHLSDEARHAVRKDAKKLRYGAEFFAGLFAAKPCRKRRRAFVAALARLQDELGALNDLASAPATLARHGLTVEPSPLEREALLTAAKKARKGFADAPRFWT